MPDFITGSIDKITLKISQSLCPQEAYNLVKGIFFFKECPVDFMYVPISMLEGLSPLFH